MGMKAYAAHILRYLLVSCTYQRLVNAAERHFNFTLGMKQAMQFGENCLDDAFGLHCHPQGAVYIRDGHMYYHNSSGNSGDVGVEMRVPESAVPNVLVMDGFYRAIPTINGQVPGPTIDVEEGDTVVVHFHNTLLNEASTLHFHGMYQRGTPWMDGVSSITQCAVLPTQSFTYRFLAEPAGTHFWHAHHGVQRPEGLFGPLIVRPKSRVESARPQPSVQRPVCDKEHLMTLSTYKHMYTAEFFTQRDVGGFFPEGPEAKQFVWGRDVSGKLESEVAEDAMLINGMGRQKHDQANSGINLTVYEAVEAETHCFRVMAGQEGKSLRVSIDQHPLIAYASDGHDFDPEVVESIIVHAGETFDFAVLGAAGGGNYWVRAESLEVNSPVQNYNNTALAILRYPGSPEADPATSGGGTFRSQCTAESRCTVLNCPFPAYPPASYTDCLQVDQLANADADDIVPDSNVEEHFLNFVFEPAINNRRFVDPGAPPLTQPEDAKIVECPDDCDTRVFPHQPCECTHYRTIPYNRTVQIVAMNLGIGAFGMHPVHLHGHSFHVLKVGYPPIHNDTGAVCVWPEGTAHPSCLTTDDIQSGNGTGFATASWTGGVPPSDLNLLNPIRKDTVVIPPGGYAVLRFRTDNPGWWHLHCHMAHHLMSGLGMLINAAPEMQGMFPPPAGFPKCHSLTDSTRLAKDVSDSQLKWQAMSRKAELLV